jgi:branched-chain amino acid transport system ATP-binding protein
MIEVHDVRAGYGDGPDILHGISMQAHAGEIVCILGPNGCGKSTLLKCIAGFVTPRAGRVVMAGQEVASVPAHCKMRDHRVGFVPQTDNVFASMSIYENVLLGTRFLPRAMQAARAQEALGAYPQLAARSASKASALSGGERQLLSLARALVSQPSILLLDEPSAGLSPRMTSEVFEAIARIRSTLNLCIIMVEQNAAEALDVADRAYVLAMGAVATQGPAAAIAKDTTLEYLYLGGADKLADPPE